MITTMIMVIVVVSLITFVLYIALSDGEWATKIKNNTENFFKKRPITAFLVIIILFILGCLKM